MKSILFSLLLFLNTAWLQQAEAPDGWKAFAKVKFEEKYHEDLEAYFYFPLFDQKIKDMEGTEVSLRGYYMPFETPANMLVLSKNPYSSCFFCGAAGPETVAEVYFKNKIPGLSPDQVITVKGRLKLNAKEIDRFNFIIEDAILLKN